MLKKRSYFTTDRTCLLVETFKCACKNWLCIECLFIMRKPVLLNRITLRTKYVKYILEFSYSNFGLSLGKSCHWTRFDPKIVFVHFEYFRKMFIFTLTKLSFFFLLLFVILFKTYFSNALWWAYLNTFSSTLHTLKLQRVKRKRRERFQCEKKVCTKSAIYLFA